MKRLTITMLCTIVLTLLTTLDLSAQLAVSIKISQMNYLQFEPIFVQVSVRNYSAHPIIFGDDEKLRGALSFEIVPDGKSNRLKLPLKDPKVYPPMTGSIIAPGGSKEYTFNLTDYYDIRQVGKYSLVAVVKHHLFNEEYISEDKFFNIVNGTTIWEMEVGIPDLQGNSQTQKEQPKVATRKYTILSYSIGPVRGNSMMYNLRVEDENMVYANRRIAFDYGPDCRPQCEIDFLSRLNILIQASSTVFAYYVFNLDGRLEKTQVLIRTGAKPVLTVDPKTGFVTVVGGREAQRDVDYEEIKGIPILGVRPDKATVAAPPPKGEALKDFDAVPED